MRNPVTRVTNLFNTLKLRYTMPLRLELSIVDHCNLNCKGCTHFCPIAPEHFMPVSEVEEALSHLSSIDNEMFESIYLLGGEPLLHANITTICHLTRQYFPKATIKILTNGLKVANLDDRFWETCRQSRIIISATIYPVNLDYAKIETICHDNGVKYEVFHQPKNGRFFTKHKIDDINPGNKHLNFLRCHQIGCLTLRDGKIYPCATSAYANLINDQFGRNFEHQPADYIAVPDIKKTSQLQRLKLRPTPFCRYCTALEATEGEQSRRQPDEWL